MAKVKIDNKEHTCSQPVFDYIQTLELKVKLSPDQLKSIREKIDNTHDSLLNKLNNSMSEIDKSLEQSINFIKN